MEDTGEGTLQGAVQIMSAPTDITQGQWKVSAVLGTDTICQLSVQTRCFHNYSHGGGWKLEQHVGMILILRKPVMKKREQGKTDCIKM
jgi:hypothetical protein